MRSFATTCVIRENVEAELAVNSFTLIIGAFPTFFANTRTAFKINQ
jgi:hypothetical protein